MFRKAVLNKTNLKIQNITAGKEDVKMGIKRNRLHLGCGNNYFPDFVNVDNNVNIKKVDLYHDLNSFPYPFEDNSIKEIIMDHILEHLDDTIRVILELYRICDNNAIITLKSPHFSCNWTHPGHKRAIGVGLFDHFGQQSFERYGNCHFKIEFVKLHWIRPVYVDNIFKRTVNSIVNFLANFNIRFCERVWCYWVGGFEELEFRIKVIKV